MKYVYKIKQTNLVDFLNALDGEEPDWKGKTESLEPGAIDRKFLVFARLTDLTDMILTVFPWLNCQSDFHIANSKGDIALRCDLSPNWQLCVFWRTEQDHEDNFVDSAIFKLSHYTNATGWEIQEGIANVYHKDGKVSENPDVIGALSFLYEIWTK
jgi:hypothetical protein